MIFPVLVAEGWFDEGMINSLKGQWAQNLAQILPPIASLFCGLWETRAQVVGMRAQSITEERTRTRRLEIINYRILKLKQTVGEADKRKSKGMAEASALSDEQRQAVDQARRERDKLFDDRRRELEKLTRERVELKQDDADAQATKHDAFAELYWREVGKWLVGSTAWAAVAAVVQKELNLITHQQKGIFVQKMNTNLGCYLGILV